MVTFRQITKEEWKRGDFRPFAEFHKSSAELFGKFQIDFEEHLVEGLGKAKTAFLITSNDNQFLITEYLEPIVPITQIFILNSPDSLKDTFSVVLKALNLDYSDLDWLDKSVIN